MLNSHEKVIEFLNKASETYYAGSPIISDEQFDAMAELYDFKSVGAKASGKTGNHFYRMYSLQKYYEDELKENPLSAYKDISYSVKLDGAAISLFYYNGALVQALTRGDGVEGQIITDKMIIGKTVPPWVKFGLQKGLIPAEFQVSGEIVASKEIPNSRNYASGAINLKDVNEFRTRAVTFIAHDCYPHLTDTYEGDMKELSKAGFSTVKDPDLDKIYPTDGLVYRINKHIEADILGYTAKHPRFAYARKERQGTVDTEILDVEWNTGRTGRVTPVAIIKPVMIDGKEVSRATLNNPGFIESLDLRIGDTVAIRLAGMIIPEIVHKVDA